MLTRITRYPKLPWCYILTRPHGIGELESMRVDNVGFFGTLGELVLKGSQQPGRIFENGSVNDGIHELRRER